MLHGRLNNVRESGKVGKWERKMEMKVLKNWCQLWGLFLSPPYDSYSHRKHTKLEFFCNTSIKIC